MSNPPLERKVRQVENDVEAIYDMFSRIEIVVGRHDARLREIQSHLLDLDTAVGERFAAHDRRFEAIEGRLGGVEGRLEGVEGRLGGVEGRLDGLTGQVTEVLEILRAR